MNTEISSKLSLYDILAMLIPGALIIFWASNVIFGNNLTIDENRINPWIVGVFFTATSYLVGIIYCKFMELLWRKCLIISALLISLIIVMLFSVIVKKCWVLLVVVALFVIVLCFLFYFKNKQCSLSEPIEIKKKSQRCQKIASNYNKDFCDYMKHCPKKIQEYLFRKRICNLFKLIERNNRKMIREIYGEVKRKIFQNKYNDFSDEKKNCCLKIRTFFKRNFQEEGYQGKKGCLDHYYEAYAFVAKNTYRNDVHILESQFAFLRSMFGVVLLYEVICLLSLLFDLLKDRFECVPSDVFKFIENFNSLMGGLFPGVSVCLISIFLLILLIAIPFVMACIQKKIYHIVWEDYEYLRRVKDDK